MKNTQKDIKKSKSILVIMRIRNVIFQIFFLYLCSIGHEILAILPFVLFAYGVTMEFLLNSTIHNIEKSNSNS